MKGRIDNLNFEADKEKEKRFNFIKVAIVLWVLSIFFIFLNTKIASTYLYLESFLLSLNSVLFIFGVIMIPIIVILALVLFFIQTKINKISRK